ncbi:MAG TPA: D-glycero-beta-D-manno-heptose-7-phosphate kinase [Candidatus Omnitrophota bacterium]|nr:D-glycero-beta-D-manno-heptose-7-phosphate kinase [Candidatus Omnitrophota bacterium]HPD84988.1 D-glycero-beta-D-manno-heptose-7-phosphate kinase [Candidatus Omnitrophota bacterium]HRZ03846.1 D-glycero-beta-D-manno-heptose-7-phosphate kinase [Candidatus Omnitrophota bacterium]
MSQYQHIIARFKEKRILVIGDVILDQYIKGTVSRISPEAPVPIVLQQGFPVYTPGGAANVASNLRSLGAKVTLIGKIGTDADGKILLKELKKKKINTAGIFADKKIPTILKTRIIAEHQQVLRVDREENVVLPDDPIYRRIRNLILKSIPSADGVIVSDYGKGMINAALVSEVCSLAIAKKKIIAVDPKVEHFSYYRGVTAITPNKKETENAIRDIKIRQNAGRKLAINVDVLKTDADVDLAGQQLVKFLNLESLLITLGNQGMRLFEKGRKPVHIDTRAREVFDVTGAGDTVISVFTLSLAAGASKHEAADLSNYAAGIVVGKMGAVPVTRKELLAAVRTS